MQPCRLTSIGGIGGGSGDPTGGDVSGTESDGSPSGGEVSSETQAEIDALEAALSGEGQVTGPS
jgi:hypothetical protein